MPNWRQNGQTVLRATKNNRFTDKFELLRFEDEHTEGGEYDATRVKESRTVWGLFTEVSKNATLDYNELYEGIQSYVSFEMAPNFYDTTFNWVQIDGHLFKVLEVDDTYDGYKALRCGFFGDIV